MNNKLGQSFDKVIDNLNIDKLMILKQLPDDIKYDAQEIRFRINAPIMVVCKSSQYFIFDSGKASVIPGTGMLITTKKDMETIFASLCEFSVHSYENEINCGYITIKGGHRAGICGTAVTDNNIIKNIRDISSINLRISRQIFGCADGVINLLKNNMHGLIIAGPPACGKTTILRDTARQIASGALGKIYRVAIADERREIAAIFRGIPQNDLGYACDCLDSYPKHIAIDHAVRCLSPKIIICDEIGTSEQVEAVSQGFNSGVLFIISVHASNKLELQKRPVVKSLINTGAFENIIMLCSSDTPGKIKEIYKAGDLYENCRNNAYNNILHYDSCTPCQYI